MSLQHARAAGSYRRSTGFVTGLLTIALYAAMVTGAAGDRWGAPTLRRFHLGGSGSASCRLIALFSF